MDYHDILGVRPNASKEEIELAYRGRRTQYHPDKYTNVDSETLRWATAKMQEVNEAYAALSGSSPRAQSATAPQSARTDAGPQPSAVEIPSFRDVVSQHLASLRGSPRAYFAPHIPHAKLHNALASYGHGLDTKDVIVLIDTTVMGGAREGILVATSGIRTKDLAERPITWNWDELHRIDFTGSNLCINGNRTVECSMAEPQRLEPLFALVQEYASALMQARSARSAKRNGNGPAGASPINPANCATVFAHAKDRLLDLCEWIGPLEQRVGREVIDRANAASHFGALEDCLRDPGTMEIAMMELLTIEELCRHAVAYAVDTDQELPPSLLESDEDDSQLVQELRQLLNGMAGTPAERQQAQKDRFFRR